MRKLRSLYRKYTKMYFDCVYHLCYSRSLVDHGNSSYNVWCKYYASEVKLLHRLRVEVFNMMVCDNSNADYCTEVSDHFRELLKRKLKLHGIDHSYYYQL